MPRVLSVIFEGLISGIAWTIGSMIAVAIFGLVIGLVGLLTHGVGLLLLPVVAFYLVRHRHAMGERIHQWRQDHAKVVVLPPEH